MFLGNKVVTSSFELTKNESLYLDIIRVLASQIVLIGHGISYFSILKFLQYPNVPYMQNIAVVLFFILSGFIITYSSSQKLENKNYSYTFFLIDRFSRIFVAFVPAIIFVTFIDFISQTISPDGYKYTSAFNLSTFIANLFMLQDFPYGLFGGITSFGSARPFWTIAIEWWIYLFFGILFFTVKGKHKNLKFSFVLLFISAIVPIYNLIGGRGNGLTLYWLFGMIACLLYPWYKSLPLSKYWKIVLALIMLTLSIHRQIIIISAYDKIFALIISIFLLISMNCFNLIKLNNKFVAIIKYMASYSFTLYLVHYSILDFIQVNFIDYNPYILFLYGFIISNLIAISIGRLTEVKLTPTYQAKN